MKIWKETRKSKEMKAEISRLKRRLDFLSEVVDFYSQRLEAVENHTRDGLIHADAEMVDDHEERITKLELDLTDIEIAVEERRKKNA